jgi:hypothetical protein
VAKVHSATGIADVAKPFEITPSDAETSGTVFFVQGCTLGLDADIVALTNAHCVENAYRNTCRVIQNNVVLGAFKIQWVCFDLDFAVLVPMEPLEMPVVGIGTNAIVPGTPVVMYGYPLDCDTCQCAHGIVSSHGNNFWIQCNISSNFGNSGGPLLSRETGAVLGIVTQSPALAEAITEIVPMWAIKQAIVRWADEDKCILRVPTLDIDCVPINKTSAAYYGCDKQDSCLLIQRSSEDGLTAGDIVHSIVQGDSLRWPATTHSGNVHTSMSGEVAIDSEALALELPAECNMLVQRKGIIGTVCIRLQQNMVMPKPVRLYYPCWEQIPYVRARGCVFTPLTRNLLDLYDGYADSEYLRDAWHAYDQRSMQDACVAVSFVHPQSHAADCGIEALMIIDTIDSKRIMTTHELAAAIDTGRECRRKLCNIVFHDNTTVIVDLHKL